MNEGPSKLLVVDGEEQVRRLLCAILARAGYDVHTARTAEEAIKRSGPSMSFDLILCETMLPGMDGHEFARHIAVRSPGTRIIFVCTFGTQCEACPHTPLCALIEKPFDPKHVLRTVAES